MSRDRQMRVLIVEDNPDFLEALRRILHRCDPNAEISTAQGVEQARALLRTRRPDLVFLDIRLPDGNGLDLLEAIRRGSPRATVVVSTNYDLPEYSEAARVRGADCFVPKAKLTPQGVEHLLSKVRLALRERAAEQAEESPDAPPTISR
ncbi:MAG: hypothetical protein Kow0092_16760 [Deferrisomatales bacterium]